jgi:hypothetical protein
MLTFLLLNYWSSRSLCFLDRGSGRFLIGILFILWRFRLILLSAALAPAWGSTALLLCTAKFFITFLPWSLRICLLKWGLILFTLVLTQFANKFVCSEACQGNAIILRGLVRKLVWCQFQQNNQTFWSKSETNDEHFRLWPIVGNIFINFGEEELGR